MPIPRTWSEELIAEWLQLNGYLVETGVLIGSKEPGGRDEADVVGVKVEKGLLYIHHIEVGNVSQGVKEFEETLKKKFSHEHQTKIERRYTDRLDLGRAAKPKYSHLYIATSVSNKILKELGEKFNIERLDEFLFEKIIPDIEKWKEKPYSGALTTGAFTPPENLWLICLIDYFNKSQQKLEAEKRAHVRKVIQNTA